MNSILIKNYRSEYDKGVNMFNPEGRIFQVEYAMAAMKVICDVWGESYVFVSWDGQHLAWFLKTELCWHVNVKSNQSCWYQKALRKSMNSTLILPAR